MGNSRKGDSDFGSVVALTIVAIAVGGALALIAPGALVVFGVDEAAGLRLDPGQAWCFSGLVSGAAFLGLRVALGEWERARGAWFALCAVAVLVTLVSAFGFHAAWPRAWVHMLFG